MYLTQIKQASASPAVQSLSSILQMKRGSISTPFADIPPANRATLTEHKQTLEATHKSSNDLLLRKRKLPSSLGRTTQVNDNDVVDLTSDDVSSKDLLATCSTNKGKLLKVEPKVTSSDVKNLSQRDPGPHQKGKETHSIAVSSSETHGAAFLTQV